MHERLVVDPLSPTKILSAFQMCVLPVPATDRKAGDVVVVTALHWAPVPPRSCPTLRLGGWVKGRGSARVCDAVGALEAATQGAGSSVGCRRGRERNGEWSTGVG
jgi:hypothetical protein